MARAHRRIVPTWQQISIVEKWEKVRDFNDKIYGSFSTKILVAKFCKENDITKSYLMCCINRVKQSEELERLEAKNGET